MRRLTVSGLTMEVPGRRLLDGLDLMVGKGDCLAVMGPSGSGKTSLLNALCGITVPAAGTVILDGTDLSRLKAGARADFRLRHIGLVFQFGELLPELSVLENVSLPLRLAGTKRAEAERRAADWLDRVGLSAHAAKHPEALSGGEVQRAGIARALCHGPGLVLADEPTGALDEVNAELVTGLLVEQAKALGAAVVIATHDLTVAARADRVLRLRDGQLETSGERPRVLPLLDTVPDVGATTETTIASRRSS
ncbi:MAG: ABC transporter ATP-binding protein [Thermomicrobiales bacterium]